VLRATIVYVVLLFALRLFGKREVGQFTLFDLVLILLVANALQPAMTGPDTSLAGGLVIIIVLVAVNFVIGRLDRTRLFHRVFTAPPAVIIKDGQYLNQSMAHEGVDQEECEMAIREHGLEAVNEVKLGVLEPDGTISIVPSGSATIRTRRKVRFRRHL